jgi:AAA domain
VAKRRNKQFFRFATACNQRKKLASIIIDSPNKLYWVKLLTIVYMSTFQPYQRKEVNILLERLTETPRSLIMIAGPRQVGKTTAIRHALQQFPKNRYRFLAIDQPDDNDANTFDVFNQDTFEQDACIRDGAWLVRQLQDVGNTVTLAHYINLLADAGLLVGLQKYAGQEHRRRASIPKLNVLNTSLMAVASGYTKFEAKADRSYWGRSAHISTIPASPIAHRIDTSTCNG